MVDFRIIGNSSPTGTPQSTGLLVLLFKSFFFFLAKNNTHPLDECYINVVLATSML